MVGSFYTAKTQFGHGRSLLLLCTVLTAPRRAILNPWSLALGKTHETAGTHRSSRQRCSRMAAHRAGSAAGAAGDRVPAPLPPPRSARSIELGLQLRS